MEVSVIIVMIVIVQQILMIQNVIMNKYIKTDIEQGLKYLKAGIMNALADIENGEEDEITLGNNVPFSLVVKCAEERGWKKDEHNDFDINGWECDCWYYMITPNEKVVMIESCLWKGCSTKLSINYDE